MTRSFFLFLLLWCCLVFFSLHHFATEKNNFYFTIDQGKDAVLVREILGGNIVLKGPTTSVEGIHTGFLWPYFLSIGYRIFAGHPYGGVFLMAMLGVLQLLILMLWIAKFAGRTKALGVGIALMFFWRFFETSLWQFNPFPLLILASSLVILLTQFLISKKGRYYLFALLFVLLGFHAEIAGATSLLIFYLLIGAWAAFKKILNRKIYLLTLITPLLFGAILIKELLAVFGKTESIYSGVSSGLGTFANTNFTQMAKEFIHILTQTIFPANNLIALAILVFVTFFFIKQKKNPTTKTFILLCVTLFVSSYFFFATNRGWRDWHTLYLYPLIYSAFLLMLFSLPRKISMLIFLLVFISQLLIFQKRFAQFPYPKTDPSILGNQLASLDWIYTHSENNGFNSYTYTSTFYDHHYQYLFWWYGKKTYGFVPCEYANYPKSPKHTYIPNYLDYSQPTLGCDQLRFLIIESDTNAQSNKDWIDQFKSQTELLEKSSIGEIRIEKRQVK